MPFKMRLMSPIVSVLLVSAAHGSPTGDAGARAAASTVVKRASATVSVAPATTSPPVQLVESRPVESGLGNPALPAAHDVWLEMIRAAKRSLDFEEFYLSTWPHEPTEDLIQAIGEAARHGVKVRLLLDGRMHRTYPRPADSLGSIHGIETRVIDMGKIAGGVQHAKFFLVDGEEVFLGSQNFDWRALKHIHELGVRVRDPRVAGVFQRVFEMDWTASGPVGPASDANRGSTAVTGGAAGATASSAAPDTVRARLRARAGAPTPPLPIRLVQAPGDTVELWPSYNPRRFIPDSTLWDRDAVVRLIDSAEHEVVVQSLTYSTQDRGTRDDAIDAALRRAAERGVAVKLLISDWETNGDAMGYLQSLARVPNVEAKLGTVPEWSGGYVPFARVEHCKYAVVDSMEVWVGTSNWEPGYFHGSRNVAVTLRNRPLALEARRVFETSWLAPGSAAVRPDEHYPPKEHGETAPPGKQKYGG